MHYEEYDRLHKEFLARLYAEAPNVFRDPPPYGIQMNPGWWPVVHEMALAIEKVLLTKDEAFRAKFSFSQIKEKYAKLTCYPPSLSDPARSDPEIASIIREAVRRCSTTCEECGAEGSWSMAESMWESIACPVHLPPGASVY